MTIIVVDAVYNTFICCVAVAVAPGVYASFAKKRRRHLMHIYEKIWDQESRMVKFDILIQNF